MKKPKASLERYSLSERILYMRQRREMTQSQLSKAADVSQSTIAQIESGDKDPSFSTLMKLAAALDCHIAVLFSSDEVHVFDMKRLRRKYSKADKLNPTLYRALGMVVAYAKEIGFLA